MKLFISYLNMHLKKELEYKISFLLSILSNLTYIVVELLTVYSLFDKFKLLDSYNTNDLLLGFSTIWLGYSLAQVTGQGFDHFSRIIKNGNFDLLLIKPRSIFIQVIGSEMGITKIGRILLSLSVFIYSSIKVIKVFNIFKIILLISMILSSYIIILSVFIIGASLTFVTIEGLEVINIFSNGTRQVSQYPIEIYSKSLKLFFTFIIPVSLSNYYPITYLKGLSTNPIYLIMPFYSIILFIISLLLFNLGKNKYCSTGS